MKFTKAKVSFLFLLIIIVTNSYSQDNRINIDQAGKDSLRIQANRLATTLLTFDTATIVKYSYPGIIDRFFEGEKNVASSLENGRKDAEAMGFKTISMEIGSVSDFANAGNEVYAFIQTKSISLIKEDTLKSESFYLAITKDHGVNWKFIDESFMLVAGIKTLFPNYNEQILMPSKREPIFIPKNGH